MLLNEIVLLLSDKYKDNIALVDKYNNFTCTYNELITYIKQFSMGLRTLGVNPGEHIARFSEKSARCLIAD